MVVKPQDLKLIASMKSYTMGDEDVEDGEMMFMKNASSDSRGRVHAVSSKRKIEVSNNNLNGIDIEFDED